ncbi:hypothetical protein PpBr36_05298 [Pyricularia pennisetigena]|uniref:hypothetical protein n=1 Tax=Pyricularia pennisetigena TaxID=1578925 RepID=UPI00114EBC6D|nr:hypothetical protein PpBr36_05298 [Pyricularia pennisetigena]TLS27380.1 hypothetical protein PpBr36_05298 [Pyricularia pennisetigena]
MSNNLGVWHKTTFEAAKERQQTYQATVTVAGHKRSHDQTSTAGHSGLSRPPPPSNQGQNNARPRQVPALPREPPRLTASKITTLEHGTKDIVSEYSQRRQFQATPTSTADPLLSLSHPAYALPNQLVLNFASLGIHSIYPWQKQCLLGPGLLRGEKNLVYTAPTGGGKSLVADVLMLKQVTTEPGAKALLVLPYVALVQEKVAWLRQVVQGMVRENPNADARSKGKESIWRRRADEDTIRVVGFFGGINIKPKWADFDIGVCTLEKANALVNTAIDDCSINQLRVAVLDELHMIDDDHRGYLFELLSTKILCLDHPIQIVGMSATLANAKLLSTWLGGHHYETAYRPIPIEEHLVYDGKVYSAATTSNLLRTACQLNGTAPVSQKPSHPMREVASSTHKELSSPVLNAVVALANETATLGCKCLTHASREFLDIILCNQSLSSSIQAGLTSEERDLVAKAYDSGILKICIATASLAAGINLPARRVILHGARMGRDLVGPSMLRQMRGRAGRKGKDEVGETYLCCQSSDLDNVLGLMHAELPHVASSLTTDRQRIQRALLEVIAIRLATSRSSLDDYMHKTLLYHSADVKEIETHVETSLANLEKLKFITMGDFQTYQATQLGKAIVAGALDPEDGTFIHNELKKALQAFVMDGDLHVLYTFTPVHEFASDINWRVFWNEMEGLDESGLRVLKLLGLKPTVINRMQNIQDRVQGGQLRQVTDEEKELARVYRRFYMALQLRDLCNEMPVHVVARKYDVPRGTVQNLAQNCQGFAAGMIKFCEHMGWGAMASVLDHFSDRLKAGAKSDLLSLAKIIFIKSRTARVFWDNGFKSVASVANADPEQLVPILMQAQSNKIRLNTHDDRQVKEKLLIKARAITESANRLWQREMQEELVEEEW